MGWVRVQKRWLSGGLGELKVDYPWPVQYERVKP